MKKITSASIIILLVAPLMASASIPLIEDFEDETPGNPPVTSFGTWTTGTQVTALVQSGSTGDPSGAQQLNLVNTGLDRNVMLSLNDQDNYDYVELWMNAGSDSSGGIRTTISGNDGTAIIRASINQDLTFSVNLMGLGSCSSTRQLMQVTFDWSAQTVDLVLLNDGASTCYSATGIPFENPATQITNFIWTPSTTITATEYVDGIVLASLAPPDGVSGTVTDNNVTPDVFLVKFTLSPDDEDQESGDLGYNLYYDSGSGTTLYDSYPPGTAVDGVVADEVLISASSNVIFWATTTMPSTGAEGGNSCTITVDSTMLGDSDSCGVAIPGEEVTGSDLTGPNGGLFGGDRSALADALQISEASLQILIGVLLLMLLIAGGWFTYGMVGAAGLGLIGLVMNYALGLFPFWTLYVMAFIGIAVGILLLKMRGVASG